MTLIHVNLKRFDVPRSRGGLCPTEDPRVWFSAALKPVVGFGLAKHKECEIVFYPPEALLGSARDTLSTLGADHSPAFGCQGVHTEDVTPGKNFGALTTSLPAAAARAYGCTRALVGHSEERVKLAAVLTAYDPAAATSAKAAAAVNRIISLAAGAAAAAGLGVTLCVGETAEERGAGNLVEVKDRVFDVLRRQVEGLDPRVSDRGLVVAYEPRWAIGPGKTPPDARYISAVSSFLKEVTAELYGRPSAVIYGGGLKEENAAAIGGIPSVDGGLIALTRFTGEIGFDPAEMIRIVDIFTAARS